MRYIYPCNLSPDEESGEGFVVTFPDVRGAITGARTKAEEVSLPGLAEDALVAALGAYVQCREDIPASSPAAAGQVLVAVPPIVAAKLALYTAMRAQGITKVALAARLGLSESAVRKLVNPDHRSHISSVERALRAVGRTLVVEDRAAA